MWERAWTIDAAVRRRLAAPILERCGIHQRARGGQLPPHRTGREVAGTTQHALLDVERCVGPEILDGIEDQVGLRGVDLAERERFGDRDPYPDIARPDRTSRDAARRVIPSRNASSSGAVLGSLTVKPSPSNRASPVAMA